MMIKKWVLALSCGLALSAFADSGFYDNVRLPSIVDCGLRDVSPQHLKDNEDGTGWGLDHVSAVRRVLWRLFYPLSVDSQNFNSPMEYLAEFYDNEHSHNLSQRELDLVLCSQLTRSSLERTQDFEGSGLTHLSPDDHFLFHLRWNLEHRVSGAWLDSGGSSQRYN